MSKPSVTSERIETLYGLARRAVKTDPTLAIRYTRLLKRIAQRTRTKVPSHIKHAICSRCGMPLIPGYNSTTRVNQRREPHIATTCHTCGNTIRIPLRRKTS